MKKKKRVVPSDAKKLLALREATGLSQTVFGEFMGRDKHQMSKYEAGTLEISKPLLILATIAGDKIARADFFRRLEEATKAAKAAPVKRERSAAGKAEV